MQPRLVLYIQGEIVDIIGEVQEARRVTVRVSRTRIFLVNEVHPCGQGFVDAEFEAVNTLSTVLIQGKTKHG
jgi:hypothetical protein